MATAPQEFIAAVRPPVEAAINSLRGVEGITAVERRWLNAGIDDLVADVGRLQGAMQRLMERSVDASPQETPSASTE
jgi:hypothetical protein